MIESESTAGLATSSPKYGYLLHRRVTPVEVYDPVLDKSIVLRPTVNCFMSWMTQSTILIERPQILEVTGAFIEKIMGHATSEQTPEDDFIWLRLAESAFRFWENDIDEIWNHV